MKNTEQIIKNAELFLIMAEKLTEEQREAQRAARRKWYHNIMEIGKQNPDDPRYVKFLNDTKERKLLESEIINSDPELKKKHLENLRLRQQKWRQKQDPTKLTQQSSESWSKVKSLKENNPLKFLLIHLGRQVAFRRKDEKKKDDPQILQSFEILANKIMFFRDNVNILSNSGDISSLPILIDEGQKLVNDIKPSLPAISKTISAIVNELNTIYDQTKNI